MHEQGTRPTWAQLRELAEVGRVRRVNTIRYRLAHWPIWIWVFFIAPGPLTFDLFASGVDSRIAAWLGLVIIGTGIAGLLGKLPGVEPEPYILRFTEDRPNPLYRRICYTFAWSAAIVFGVLNLAGLMWAIATGEWRLRQIYDAAYFPLAGLIWILGAAGMLPRVRRSTRHEGHERRFFYGTIWAVCVAQPVLLAALEVAAARALGRRREVVCLRGDPGGHGRAGTTRAVDQNPAGQARRAGGVRLV